MAGAEGRREENVRSGCSAENWTLELGLRQGGSSGTSSAQAGDTPFPSGPSDSGWSVVLSIAFHKGAPEPSRKGSSNKHVKGVEPC